MKTSAPQGGPVPNPPSHNNPGQKEPGRDNNGNNDKTSRPKNPDNDPDQTPEREVTRTPQLEPDKGDPSKVKVNPVPGKK
jgi:hypothetical protein